MVGWSKDLGPNKMKHTNIYRPVSDQVRCQGVLFFDNEFYYFLNNNF